MYREVTELRSCVCVHTWASMYQGKPEEEEARRGDLNLKVKETCAQFRF